MDRKEIKNIYKTYFRSKNNRRENLRKIEEELTESQLAKKIIKFIENSDRGII